jgi:diacylglycerol kinase family enzyme
MAMLMIGGRQGDLDMVKVFKVQSGNLAAAPSRRVTVDGEICLSTPVDFSIDPGALRVAVPADSTLDSV